MSKIIFSSHSLLKMEQRAISKDKIIKTIEKPDRILPGLANRKSAYRKFGKIYLKVVFVQKNGMVTIITQHWDKKFKL